jgi:hypothetical protein
MGKSARIVAVTIVFFLSGCSSEMAKRAAYESMQNKAQMDYRQHPGSACLENENYVDYQRSLNKRRESGK